MREKLVEPPSTALLEAKAQFLRSLATQLNKDGEDDRERLDEDAAARFVQALLEEE